MLQSRVHSARLRLNHYEFILSRFGNFAVQVRNKHITRRDILIVR